MHSRDTIYHPIGQRSIRLLSIKPGFPSESIECALITVNDVEDPPSYEAISYVWGLEMAAEPITCNGVPKSVTKNLYDALKHLRPFPNWDSVILWPEKHVLHSSRNAWGEFAKNRNEQRENASTLHTLVWIDSICINQEDVAERESQVKMMGTIYEKAGTVKIWLGKGDAHLLNIVGPSHIGRYGVMPVVLSFIAQAMRNIQGGRNRLVSLKNAEDSVNRNMAYGFPAPSASEWDILREFFSNPWFQRVWVVQEAVLAKQAVAILGDWEIQWSALGQAALWFQTMGYAVPPVLKYPLQQLDDLLPVSAAAATWEMYEIHNVKNQDDKMHDDKIQDCKIPLLDLLREFRNRHATQPVDKVYAAFGLSEETRQFVDVEHYDAEHYDGELYTLIKPDYNQSTKNVYRNVALFLIKKHRNLLVLSHAGETQTIEQSSWPSWVPDWCYEKAAMPLSISRNPNAYNADGDEPLSTDTLRADTSADGINLQGVQADVIKAYGDQLTSYGFGFKTYQEERDFVGAAWNLLAKRPQPTEGTGEDDTFHTFISTLTAGPSNESVSKGERSGFLKDATRWFLEHLGHQIATVSMAYRMRLALSSKVDSGRFHQAFVRACMDRRFFLTQDGRMGIGPKTMKEGDMIVVLFGGKVPFVVRPSGTRFRFIGECYVPGLMKGEAVEQWRARSCDPEVFELY